LLISTPLEQKAKLETLLLVPEGTRSSPFDRYQKGPVTIIAPAFNAAMERYLELKGMGINEIDFSHIPLLKPLKPLPSMKPWMCSTYSSRGLRAMPKGSARKIVYGR
jgi:hypothetical protein